MAKLGAMLRKTEGQTGTRDSNAVSLTVKDIPIGDIQIKENVRRTYTGIEELAASIKQHGLLQPITVYPKDDGYIVKTGHRRFQAYCLLYKEEPERYHSIRCIISNADRIAIIQLVENVQREDLSQIDLYNALKTLKEKDMTNKQIAEIMGKTEQYIKFLFIGINEISKNNGLEERLSIAGNTIQDIIETKGVSDKGQRDELLEQRAKGEISRLELRAKVKALREPRLDIEEPVKKAPAKGAASVSTKQETALVHQHLNVGIGRRKDSPLGPLKNLQGIGDQIRSFITEHVAKEPFTVLLDKLRKDKGMVNSDLYEKAMVDRRLYSKMMNKRDYHPTKKI
jgi:ParB family chromosome partitioning protein